MASPSLSTDARKAAANAGHALPDGSYPMRNKAELAKAVLAFGRSKPEERVALKALIVKRATALGCTNLIPSTWKS